MEKTPRRKGAMRRSEIPPEVLRSLNEGREETAWTVNHALRTLRKREEA